MSSTWNSVPASVTSFVGREADIAELLALLRQSGERRLITVTGTGGVGKTRLVVEVLRRLSDSFADGIWMVELAGIQRAEQIVPRIANVLGIDAPSSANLLDVVVNFVSARDLLLVFDNCEHLVDDLAAVVNTLLLKAPRVRVLCTSREAIHLPGEQRLSLTPMDVSWPVAEERKAQQGLGTSLQMADVIRLFADRAAAVSPGFVVSGANVADVAAICRLLDGIPLAVELAAAQVRIFTPREIADRLRTDLDFLSNGRGGVARHHTLEAAIAWSEQLLTPVEQLLLHRMTVFAESASLSAIEEVCGDERLPVAAIVPALTRLVDKSLIITLPAGKQMRYSMLRTIQRVAQIGLDQRGERELLARRHAAWVWEMGREGFGVIYTTASLEWVRRLEIEGGNLRQAIAFSIEHDPQVAADIVSNLAWYWLWRNHMREAQMWTQAILAHPLASSSPHIQARMLFTTAMSRAWTFDFEGALGLLEESLAQASAAGDDEFRHRIHEYYTLTALYSGRLELARQILDEFAARPDGAEKPLLFATTTFMRGIIERDSGNVEEALAKMESGLRMLRAFGEPFMLCAQLFELAITYRAHGDHRRAAALFLESHELAVGSLNAPFLTLTFLGMAEISQAGSNLREALDWFEAGLEHLHGQGLAPTTLTVRSLAYIAGEAGSHALAVSLYTTAGVPWPLQKALSSFAEYHYRRQFAHADDILGEAEFGRARREGAYWSAEEAIQHGIEKLRVSLADGVRTESPELQVRLLGSGQVLLSDQLLEMVDWKYALARDLLFYLITVGERTREQIVLDFWPEVDPARARNRLNVTVHFLRRALGTRHWIVFESNRYRFDPAGPYSCDVDDFYSATALASRCAQNLPAQAIASLEYAISLVRGPFLEDVTDGDWHEPLRAAIHRDYQSTLLRLANLQIDNGLAENAVYTLSQALRAEPFAEEIYRCLMRAHLLRRDLVQVMQVYRHLCELLAEEFSTPPAAETVALYEEIVSTLRSEPTATVAPAFSRNVPGA